MKEDIHDIDKLFQAVAEQHNEGPSPNVWRGVESSLNKKKGSEDDRKFSLLKNLIFLLLLLLTGSIFFEIIQYRELKALESSFKLNLKNSPEAPNTIALNKSGSAANLHNSEDGGSPSATATGQLNNTKSDHGKDNTDKNVTDSAEEGANGKNQFTTHEKNSIKIRAPGAETESQSNKVTPQQSDIYIKRKGKNQNNSRKGYAIIATANETGTLKHDDHGKNMNLPQTKAIPAYYFAGLALHITPKLVGRQLTPLKYKGNTLAANMVKDNNGIKTISIKKNKFIKSGLFSITGFYSPDFYIYNLKNNTSSPSSPGADKDDLKKSETSKYSYTVGLLADYWLTNHFSIRSGISFSDAVIQSSAKDIYAEKDSHGNIGYLFNGSCGFGFLRPPSRNGGGGNGGGGGGLGGGTPLHVGDTLMVLQATNALQNISIPLALKYSITKGRFEFYGMAGASMNFLTKGSFSVTYNSDDHAETQSISNVEGLKKLTFSGLVSMGAEFRLSKRTSIALSPNGRFALSSINTAGSVKSYPKSFGISTGIKLKL